MDLRTSTRGEPTPGDRPATQYSRPARSRNVVQSPGTTASPCHGTRQNTNPAGERTSTKAPRHVREIQVHAVMLPRPFAERLETVSAFFGDRAIGGLQGDNDRLVAHNSSRHGLAVVTAFLHGKPVPAAPAFVAAYTSARTQADGVLGGNWPAE